MFAWEAIQKTVDYIEENLSGDIEIKTLAEIAGLSPFYYQRLFSRLVQKPVKEYIRLRRLAAASKILSDKNQRIIDVALDCGFGSHEAFTRSFKDAYGITPEQFRSSPKMLNHFDKPDLSLAYISVDEGFPLIGDGLVLEFNRCYLHTPVLFMGVTGIIPIEGQMPAGKATGIDMPGEVWRHFHEIKQDIPRISNAREIGVAYFGNAPEGHFTYFAGAEVAYGEKKEGYTNWELPAQAYIICGFEAENFEALTTVALNKALQYSRGWMERKGIQSKAYTPEVYGSSTPESSYMELWIPVEGA